MHLVHCLKHGGWTVCCHLWLLRARDLITQLYLRNTSNLHYEEAAKIYKLHVKRQAVLQGTVQDGTDRDRLVVKRSEAGRQFFSSVTSL